MKPQRYYKLALSLAIFTILINSGMFLYNLLFPRIQTVVVNNTVTTSPDIVGQTNTKVQSVNEFIKNQNDRKSAYDSHNVTYPQSCNIVLGTLENIYTNMTGEQLNFNYGKILELYNESINSTEFLQSNCWSQASSLVTSVTSTAYSTTNTTTEIPPLHFGTSMIFLIVIILFVVAATSLWLIRKPTIQKHLSYYLTSLKTSAISFLICGFCNRTSITFDILSSYFFLSSSRFT